MAHWLTEHVLLSQCSPTENARWTAGAQNAAQALLHPSVCLLPTGMCSLWCGSLSCAVVFAKDWTLRGSFYLCWYLTHSTWTVNLHFFFNAYLFLRERKSTSGEGAGKEGDIESEAGSRLWAVSTEPDVGLEPTNCEIVTWAEVGRSTDWAPQAPLGLLIFHLLKLKPQLPPWEIGTPCSLTTYVPHLGIMSVFSFFQVSLFWENASGGGTRERIPNRLSTISTEPHPTNREITTWAEIKSQMLNRLSHPRRPHNVCLDSYCFVWKKWVTFRHSPVEVDFIWSGILLIFLFLKSL